MSRTDDGGPAFPEAIAVGPAGDVCFGFSGMTLRDWFAGQALTEFATFISMKHSEETAKVIAELSYTMADAMLKAREASDVS